MDIFFEQLVKIKRTPLNSFLMLGSLFVTAALATLMFLYSNAYPILIVGIVAVGYAEWKLLGYFYKEYEYINTNGAFDIDCIIGKSSRKRIISFDCEEIVRIGKYNPKNPPVTDASEKYICANLDNAYFLLVKKGGRKVLVVASLNEKMLESIKASVPRNMAITLFSEI